MKQFTLTLAFGLASCLTVTANSLLNSPVTGTPFTTGKVNDIELISNGTDAALVVANNTTGKVYIIDINDSNPADSASNVITSVLPNFTASISTAIGISGLTVLNFEVNPLSKSVWVLVKDGSSNHYVVKVTNNGATITAFSFASVSYSAITFSGSSMTIQDMTWGNNTLFISTANSSLNGEVGKISAPFTHNASTSNRATTMFKSNWGGFYYTSAPLEKMEFGAVAGINRLMGVTVCAPGFSFPETSLSGSGLLQVTEDFDMWTMASTKVISVTQNGDAFLVDLHEVGSSKSLYRIGERFLDGSQVTANQYNSTSVALRDWAGNPSTGLTSTEIYKYTGTYKMAAFFTDYELLVLDGSDNLKLFIIGTSTVGVDEAAAGTQVRFFPNPAQGSLTISHDKELPAGAVLTILTIEGREALKINLDNSMEHKVDISSLSQGQYLISIVAGNSKILSDKLIVR